MLRSKPREKSFLEEDCECLGITFGTDGKYIVHIGFAGNILKLNMQEARIMAPRETAKWILNNDLLIVPGFEWAALYGCLKPLYPAKPLTQKEMDKLPNTVKN